MPLRRKTLLIISVTLVGLIVALYAASRVVLLGSFAELEERDAQRNVERVLSAVADDLVTIDHECSNAATWDEAYAFIQNASPDFVKSEIGNGASSDPAQRRLNLELYIRSSGQIVFGEGFDLAAQKETPIPAGLREHLFAGSRLLAESGLAGIVLLPNGPVLVASRPILTTAGKGPIRGSLIMGRYLDNTEIKRLGEKTHLSVTLLRFDDSRVPRNLLAAGRTLSGQAPILVRPVNAETVAGYTVLRDIYGRPVLALGVDMPREIYKRGRASVLYFIVSLVLMGLVFGLATLFLLEKAILSRLTGLSGGVTRIGKSTDLSARVALDGRDELSSLAGEINRMLEALERSQQEHRESEERFQIVGRATNDAVWDWNLVTNVIWRSEGTERLFGYSREERWSNPGWWQDHIHPDDRDRVLSCIRAVIDGGGEKWSEEYRYRRGDGSYAHVNDRGYVIHGEMGKAVRMIGAMMDITERKRVEEMLRRSHEELEARVHERTAELRELNEVLKTEIAQRKRTEEDLVQAKEGAEAASRAKSEFLANMSHEIRTPMNGILGMTELALDSDLTPEQRDYLVMVKASADSLLTIINDILDFSKIEAGKLDLESIEFSLCDSLDLTMKSLALRAHKKGLELNWEVRPGVPQMLVGDPTRVRQIVVNLTGNAIKFTEQGEVTVRVEQESEEGDSAWLHFSVTDTGIGIPADKRAAILEAFTQADGSTARRYGGTGLGLTISRRLVELMGGRLWLESAPGRGSTFHFTVGFGVGRRSKRTVPTQQVNLEDVLVLVVDDNSTNRRILQRMLTGWHMKPTLAECARNALSSLQQAMEAGRPYPLVLVNANMPEVDGFAFVEQVRQDPRLEGATIVMLTSAGQRGDATRCRELGVAAYITKPVGQSELLNAILQVLGTRSQEAVQPSLVTLHSLREGRKGLRILLAEDNLVNQILVVRLLTDRGHMVEVSGNGREALDKFARERFDLVLMDVQMPEMDGFEATAAIREMEKASGNHALVIAMTAHAMKGDRERCLAAGMDGYVAKPIVTQELFKEIENLI